MDIDTLLRTFVALFATMNALSVLPLIVSLVHHLPKAARHRTTRKALAAGTLLAAALALTGRTIFGFLAITISDMRMAGGLVLLVFAVHDLLFSAAARKQTDTGTETAEDGGIVPIGIPILVGPAAMAAILVTSDSAGAPTTLVAIGGVALFNLVILEAAPAALATLGADVTRAFGKVMSLFLAAIAVSMIRVGAMDLIAQETPTIPETQAP